MGATIVKIADLHFRYRNAAEPVFGGLNLTVRPGELLAVLGPSEAGKSTLALCLNGLIPRMIKGDWQGRVEVDGLAVGDCRPRELAAKVGVLFQDFEAQLFSTRVDQGCSRRRRARSASSAVACEARSAWDLVRQGLVMVPEGRGTFTRMTITENLQMGAYVRTDGEIADDLDRVFALFPRLKERRHQLAGTMSGGEQQMLAMGRALMARPKVLLLDEPSMGLSPIMVDKIFEVVADIHRRGTTVLLVEQNASRALQLADRGYVMDSGEVTMAGAAQALLSDPKVRAAYLGE